MDGGEERGNVLKTVGYGTLTKKKKKKSFKGVVKKLLYKQA